MTYITDSKSAAELLFDSKHQLFLNFHAHTDQAEKSIIYLTDKVHTLINDISLKSPLHYLDVGCGYGYTMLSMINNIQKYHDINSVALDPSKILLSLFKEQITQQNIELICSTWENYHTNRYFDFISSIHTFYYIDNWEYAIAKMRKMLDKNGVICIALRSNDVVCKFRDYFYKKIHHGRKKERNCAELCDLLNRLGIRYQIDIVTSQLDINDCLLQNEKGKQLIEFLLRQPYANLHEINDEITSYLKTIHQNGYLTQQDGYVWISNN